MIDTLVTIPLKDGKELSGRVRKPIGVGQFPVVILIQGIGWNYHEDGNSHDEIATYLCMHGFVAVQFDFSYQQKETDMLQYEIPLSQRAYEAESVIRWVAGQSYVDAKRIGLYAMSWGCMTVLSAHLTNVASVVFVGGIGFRPGQFIERYEKKGAVVQKDSLTKLPRSSGKSLVLEPGFWREFDILNQEELVSRFYLPSYIIHGSEDVYVTKEDMQAVAANFHGKKRLKVFKGGDHGIRKVPKSMRKEFLHDVVSWFRETL